MSPLRRGAPALILALATALRFTGIGWGLRHLPYQYERVFVQSVWDMVTHHDLNQRSFLYPGLFFYLLYLPVTLVQRAGLTIPYAYLAARCLVATFGVLNVAGTALLGSRLATANVGLAAALFVAVSPLEVETCHAVRPDVVLETFVLLAFLVFQGIGLKPGGDVRSGLVIGAATAVKVTGVLLAPCYLAYRLLKPGPRRSRILLAGLLSLSVFILATPYAVVAPDKFFAGLRAQLDYHYQAQAGAASSHEDLLLFYLRTIVEHLGFLGSAFLLAGIVIARREWTVFGPLLAFPLLFVVVFSTARVGGDRFLVPAGGILAIAAARALKAPLESRVGWVLAGLAALFPLVASIHFLRRVSEPSSMDRALDFIHTSLPGGSRIFTAEKHLGLDRTRYKVTWPEGNLGLGDAPTWRDRLLAHHMDLVVADPQDPTVEGFAEVHRVQSRNPYAPPTLGLFVPPTTVGALVPLERARLDASENPGLVPSLAGERGFWSTSGTESPGDWIQIDLPSPVRLVRVEITPKNHIGSPLRLLVPDDGGNWRELPVVEMDDSDEFPPRQILLLEPTRLHRLRLAPAKPFVTRWAVIRLRLLAATEGVGAQ
jgi:hypothetical protein